VTKVVKKHVAKFHDMVQLSVHFASQHDTATVFHDEIGPIAVLMPHAEYARLKRLEQPATRIRGRRPR
jgi:hypothetical protein